MSFVRFKFLEMTEKDVGLMTLRLDWFYSVCRFR